MDLTKQEIELIKISLIRNNKILNYTINSENTNRENFEEDPVNYTEIFDELYYNEKVQKKLARLLSNNKEGYNFSDFEENELELMNVEISRDVEILNETIETNTVPDYLKYLNGQNEENVLLGENSLNKLYEISFKFNQNEYH